MHLGVICLQDGLADPRRRPTKTRMGMAEMYAMEVSEKFPERVSEDRSDTAVTGRIVENARHDRLDHSEKTNWRCGAKTCVSGWPDDLRWSEI